MLLILSSKELIWQKRGSQIWLSLPRTCSKLSWLRSTGISGCDSQMWLPRFCHINSLEDKISNTAATIQPNPFWFWENQSIYLCMRFWTHLQLEATRRLKFSLTTFLNSLTLSPKVTLSRQYATLSTSWIFNNDEFTDTQTTEEFLYLVICGPEW